MPPAKRAAPRRATPKVMKLPNGATSVPVGPNSEYVIVHPMNAFRPPIAEYLTSTKKVRLIPSDLVENFAGELPEHHAIKLRRLVKTLRGEPETE